MRRQALQNRGELLQERSGQGQEPRIFFFSGAKNGGGVEDEVPKNAAILVVRRALALPTHLAQNLRDDAQRGEQARVDHAAHVAVHGVRNAQHRRHQIRAPRELRVQHHARAPAVTAPSTRTQLAGWAHLTQLA